MQDEGGTPAYLDEIPLEGATYLQLEKEVVRIGTLHHVLDGGGNELFQIQRPKAQAAASEAIRMVTPGRRSGIVKLAVGASTGNWRSPGTIAEHALDRWYDMWTQDDRWLGRIDKDQGSGAARWTLILCDWLPRAWMDVVSAGPGPTRAQMYDATGRPSLFLPRQSKRDPFIIVDGAGGVVAELKFGMHGWRDVTAIVINQPVHPIYLIFFAVVVDYELHPSE